MLKDGGYTIVFLSLKSSLNKIQLDLILLKGDAISLIAKLCEEYKITTVYWTACYEPLARKRDEVLLTVLTSQGIEVIVSHNSVLMPPFSY